MKKIILLILGIVNFLFAYSQSGKKFLTELEAVENFYQKYTQKGLDEEPNGAEVFTFIFQDNNGLYYYSEPILLGPKGGDPEFVDGAIAMAHTHGRHSSPSNNMFSPEDIKSSYITNMPIYGGFPNGTAHVFYPSFSRDRVTGIRLDFSIPYDPSDPQSPGYSEIEPLTTWVGTDGNLYAGMTQDGVYVVSWQDDYGTQHKQWVDKDGIHHHYWVTPDGIIIDEWTDSNGIHHLEWIELDGTINDKWTDKNGDLHHEWTDPDGTHHHEWIDSQGNEHNEWIEEDGTVHDEWIDSEGIYHHEWTDSGGEYHHEWVDSDGYHHHEWTDSGGELHHEWTDSDGIHHDEWTDSSGEHHHEWTDSDGYHHHEWWDDDGYYHHEWWDDDGYHHEEWWDDDFSEF
ncbi:hypothetical protein [Flammeovirga aprica]|uniref:DUF4329 domain-containing protein n=1 Tax=Flammeovirga aprica JL-4 TaxID=694437 RepID=A0A7X9RZP9_9BACT|nr:hypothetical protein [Flammeovirga aprica]NME71676.1 hypothetical protein [Flammeovirga aprica JL-4]